MIIFSIKWRKKTRFLTVAAGAAPRYVPVPQMEHVSPLRVWANEKVRREMGTQGAAVRHMRCVCRDARCVISREDGTHLSSMMPLYPASHSQAVTAVLAGALSELAGQSSQGAGPASSLYSAAPHASHVSAGSAMVPV
jgi:hypothetical protein